MIKSIQLAVVKSKTLYNRWPQKPIKRSILRLLSEAQFPAGLYRFELQQIQEAASGRLTEVLAEPLTNEFIRLKLNTQLNGHQYFGQLQLSGNARSALWVQRLQAAAMRLDADSWVAKASGATATPSGEGRRALATRVAATLMGYAPGTEAVIPESKTDTRIQAFLEEIAHLQAGFSRQLAEVKSLQKQEQGRHSGCVNSLSVFGEDGDHIKEKRLEAIEALRASEVALQAFHMQKVRLIRGCMSDLARLQRSLQDGSWKRP